MAEQTESVRKDSAKRQIENRAFMDWSGKRMAVPKGTTLPSDPRPFEVFGIEDAINGDKLFMFSPSSDAWVTVGKIV